MIVAATLHIIATAGDRYRKCSSSAVSLPLSVISSSSQIEYTLYIYIYQGQFSYGPVRTGTFDDFFSLKYWKDVFYVKNRR